MAFVHLTHVRLCLIPFSSLRYNVVDGQVTMGLLAYRWLPREFELDTFPSMPEELGFWAFVRPSQGGDIVIAGADSRTPLYVTPYVLGGRSHVKFEDIRALAHPVLRHRVLINYRAEAEGVVVDDLVDRLLKSIKES